MPPLFTRFAAVWLAVVMLFYAAFLVFILIPIGSIWASQAAFAPAGGTTVVTLSSLINNASPTPLLQNYLTILGINVKPPRKPWVPSGVDYGNTRVPSTPQGEPICMAWQYNPRTLAAVPPGVNTLSPRWFYVEDNHGTAVVDDLAHLISGKVSGWDPNQYVKTAHAGGAKVWAQVACLSEPDLAEQIVMDDTCRSQFISQIAGWVQQYDLDGINFDFEDMDPTYMKFYTQLIAECKQALPAGTVVSVCVTVPLQNSQGNWWQSYDRMGLGEVADYVAVMTYQYVDMEPTAAIDWVSGKVEDMLEMVPSDKILLGVPFYGVDFIFDAPVGDKLTQFPDIENSKSHRNFFPSYLQSLLSQGYYTVGTKKITVDYWIEKAVWSDETATTHYSFVDTDGLLHLVYCDDADSLLQKGRLLAFDQLGGAAVWTLDYGQPPLWKALQDGMTSKH